MACIALPWFPLACLALGMFVPFLAFACVAFSLLTWPFGGFACGFPRLAKPFLALHLRGLAWVMASLGLHGLGVGLQCLCLALPCLAWLGRGPHVTSVGLLVPAATCLDVPTVSHSDPNGG